MAVRKSSSEVATIDVALVTIETADDEFGFTTSNQIEVEVQTEDQDAVRLVVKGKLIAQKKQSRVIVGNQITLHDNVFNADLVEILQGGTVHTDAQGNVTGYTPPVAGSDYVPTEFTLNVYTPQYDAAGTILQYEKIAYPNCTGQPVALNSEDNAFRAPEYVIDSAPHNGEAPYDLTYVASLPVWNETSVNYVLTSDATFQESKTYYTRTGSGTYSSPYVYTAASVEAGEAVTANTYYEVDSD